VSLYRGYKKKFNHFNGVQRLAGSPEVRTRASNPIVLQAKYLGMTVLLFIRRNCRSPSVTVHCTVTDGLRQVKCVRVSPRYPHPHTPHSPSTSSSDPSNPFTNDLHTSLKKDLSSASQRSKWRCTNSNPKYEQ